MGKGSDLGLQLKQWLETDPQALRSGQALANRFIDALGAEDALRAPLRDLATQPLLLEALHRRGASRSSAVLSLAEQLSHTYSPAVLSELLELLEAATGVSLPRPDAEATQVAPASSPPSTTRERVDWQGLGPGLALAGFGALVFHWAGQELDRSLFERWGWSAGVVLVLLLGLIQALAIGPLRALPRRWCLNSEQASQPRQAWRWLSAAWVHANPWEAALNLLLLLVLLGNTPLPLGDVLLRYSLTALACLAASAALALHWQVPRRWSGSSGPISALIALAAGLSLLQGRVLRFESPVLAIPAWVLLLVYGALQLGWQLPRTDPEDPSTPVQRLLSIPWTWGLLFGLAWALISWLREPR